MRFYLALLVVLVSAQEKDNKIDLAFDTCPLKGNGCPQNKCCTEYSCDKQNLEEGRRIKCCSKEDLIREQQLPSEEQRCSPCVKCSKCLVDV